MRNASLIPQTRVVATCPTEPTHFSDHLEVGEREAVAAHYPNL
jgi:hypothetical protein